MVIELLKAVLFGIVEGVTEWLPISSTGHLILLDEFITLNVSDAFKSMFDVVIQLGAILAVIVLFFHKLNPFSPSKSDGEKKQTWQLWFKVIAAIIPSGIVGVLFDDWMEEHLHNAVVVSIALIVYGIAFILVERRNTRGKFQRISTRDGATVARLKQSSVDNVFDITYRTALIIGCFQCLSLIPGTSRSGSTILGAILIGVGRSAGAEFSFFMAIPTMLGASAIKMLKFLLSGVSATGTEIGVLVVGCVVSFVVSLLVIKGLMQYVRSHSFSAFGVYRIVLGIIVLAYFALFACAEFSELAYHCEEGEARRGNPHSLWHSDDEASPKENGLPRQCAHWLAITCCLNQRKNNDTELNDQYIEIRRHPYGLHTGKRVPEGHDHHLRRSGQKRDSQV